MVANHPRTIAAIVIQSAWQKTERTLDNFNKNHSRARERVKQEHILIPNQENRRERGVTQRKSIRTGSFPCS